MKKTIALLFALATFAVRGQNLTSSSDCATNPPDFVNLPYQEADNTLYSEEQKKICSEYINNLINQLKNPKLSDDNKTLAIYFLGELRPLETNSVNYLIENIDFKATKFDPKTRFPRWGEYPAKEALIKIGEPVVNPILDDLPNETNQLRRQLLCDVLKQVWSQQQRDSAK